LVTLAIRPEKLRLAPAFGDTGAAPALRGWIDARLYVGSDTSFVVRLDRDRALRIRRQNNDTLADAWSSLEPGAEVTVSWAPESVRVLTE
jgi:ABC-type Fe3+/spermidine/putrescine transport system ATPase subunit